MSDLRTQKTLLNGSDIARDAIKRYLQGREILSEMMQEGDTMYESPVTTIYDRVAKDANERLEDYIVEEILRVGVIVDKDELIRALNYDRRQYQKGYQDGKAAAIAEIVRRKDCKHRIEDEEFERGHYCVKRPQNGGRFCEDNDFCSCGERRDE